MYKSRTHQFKLVLYGLKRRFGVPATLVKVTKGTTDLTTGQKNVTLTRIELLRVVQLPTDKKRKFEYDISYLAANKNFSYGAFVNLGLREFLICRNDLDPDFELTKADYLIWDGQRFNIEHFFDLDYNLGYYIYGKESQAEPPYQSIQVSVRHALNIGQGVENV